MVAKISVGSSLYGAIAYNGEKINEAQGRLLTTNRIYNDGSGKVDKTLVDYYTKLSDFHAQFRAVGTNYNQVVKELRLHFSEKKAMALLYKLEQHTVELVKLSRQIVELSRELKEQREQSQTCLDSAESRLKKSETQMEAKWSQKSV